MKRIFYLLAALYVIVSCQGITKENWETLRVDNDHFTYPYSATRALLYIYFNDEWTAQVTKGSDWATLDMTSGRGVCANHLRFSTNPGFSRECEVTITGGSTVLVVRVTQDGQISVPQIVFENASTTVIADKTSAILSVDSNLPMDIFKALSPIITYQDDVYDWISKATILDVEETVVIPGMPDGTRRFLQLDVSKNLTGINRKATISLCVTDAAGTEYSGSTEFIQSSERAYISLPAMDRVDKSGGVKTIPITTNIGEAVSLASVEVSYSSATATGFISDAHITTNSELIYTVSENTSDQARNATIKISYEDLSAVMDVIQKAQSSSYSDFTIESVSDFMGWASDYSVWKNTDNIKLGADIDLTGHSYLPHEFLGVFDGQGHTITGIDVVSDSDAGFFTVLKGTLKNVVFGTAQNKGSITSSSAEAGACVGLIAKLTENAKIDNVTSYVDIVASGSGISHAGGIVALCATTGTIKDCTYSGNVSLTASSVAASNVGGIAAEMTVAGKISNCVNNGQIYVSSPAQSKGGVINMAGILGKASANGTLESCTNTGVVMYENKTTNANAVVNQAGILGLTSDMPLARFDGCSNQTGADIVNRGPSAFVDAAGLVGQYEVQTPVTNCQNFADLYFEGSSSYHYVGGAIGNIPLNVVGGTIAHNTVKCDLTMSGSTSLALRAGLFAGSIGGSLSIDDCHVEGKLISTSLSSKGTRLAGFLGSATSATFSISSSSAKCEVSNKSAALADDTIYLGGFIAYGTATVSFTDCTAEGSVLSQCEVANEYVGGFVGYSSKIGPYTRSSAQCDITLAHPDAPVKAGAFAGLITVNPTISDCSVGASKFATTVLTSANYGAYLKGSSSTTSTNINTTTISFKE